MRGRGERGKEGKREKRERRGRGERWKYKDFVYSIMSSVPALSHKIEGLQRQITSQQQLQKSYISTQLVHIHVH